MKFIKKIEKVLRKYLLINLFSDIYITVVRYLNGSSGNWLRYKYYKKRLKYLGKNVIIDTGVFIEGAEYISIGDNTHIDKNCILVGCPPDLDLSYRYVKKRDNPNYKLQTGEISIGKSCHISQNTMIYGYGGVDINDNSTLSAGAKIYSLTSMAYNPFDRTEVVSIVPYEGKSPTLMGPVVLGKNVWVGIDCIISPGVSLGNDVFVKSQTIINSSFANNSYVGGSPARKERVRFEKYNQ